MPARTRTNLATLIAPLALVLACGGTAVAAGLAKDSVTSKSIKNNAVKSKDLKDNSVTSKDVRDGSLGSADVQDGSLGAAEVTDDGLTGADIAEGTLATVPNATAVGGVQVTPLSLTLPSTSAAVRVLAEAGNYLDLDCQTGSLPIEVHRAASGPPLVFTALSDPGNNFVDSLAGNDTLNSQSADGTFKVAMSLPGGASVTVEFTGIYELNAEGVNDCFYRGTITRIP
jgi:hypothetical protein